MPDMKTGSLLFPQEKGKKEIPMFSGGRCVPNEKLIREMGC